MKQLIILTIALVLSMEKNVIAQDDQIFPLIVQDMLAAKSSDAMKSGASREISLGWDKVFLDSSVLNSSPEILAAPGSNGKCDIVIINYSTNEWNITTKQAMTVWLAEIECKFNSNIKPEEIIGRVINIDQAVKSLRDFNKWNLSNLNAALENTSSVAEKEEIRSEIDCLKKEAISVQPIADFVQNRNFRLESVGRFSQNNLNSEKHSYDVYRIVGAEPLKTHFLSYLRIVKLKGRYLLWSLKYEGQERALVTGYSYMLNSNWFILDEACDSRRKGTSH